MYREEHRSKKEKKAKWVNYISVKNWEKTDTQIKMMLSKKLSPSVSENLAIFRDFKEFFAW